MIVIQSAKVFETDRDIAEIYHMRPYESVLSRDGEQIMNAEEVRNEIVQGKRFVRRDGETLVLGCSQEVQDLIGIQYESWDNMHNHMSDLRDERFKAELELGKKEKDLTATKNDIFIHRGLVSYLLFSAMVWLAMNFA